MLYAGDERRKSVIHAECKFEDRILATAEGVIRLEGKVEKLDMRINGSLEKIANHINEGTWYRRLIIGTAISLALSILGGIYTAATIAYNMGQYTQQIKINTSRIDKIENGVNK